MPAARPPLVPKSPAPLPAEEIAFIKDTIRRFYGDYAIVRTFGPNPARLDLHVETDRNVGMAKYDCLGVLMTRIERPIALEATIHGTRIHGSAKLAYRQGVIL